MKIVELEINIMAVPQGYYLAQGISRDLNFKVGLPAAIRCFLDSEDYESFIRNVLSFKCDSDTLGAIGGGIAEEFYKGTGFNNDELLKKYLDERLYGIVKESK